MKTRIPSSARPHQHLQSGLRRLPGFTLPELLIAITVLVLLASVAFTLFGKVNRDTALAKTEKQLKLLEAKVQSYTGDVRKTPQGRDDFGIMIYSMLFGDGVGEDLVAGTADDSVRDCRPDEGAHVYLAGLDPHVNSLKMIEHGPAGMPRKLIDPYGHPWRYRAGAEFGAVNPDFDIWSVGPDGRDETADDIRNW